MTGRKKGNLAKTQSVKALKNALNGDSFLKTVFVDLRATLKSYEVGFFDTVALFTDYVDGERDNFTCLFVEKGNCLWLFALQHRANAFHLVHFGVSEVLRRAVREDLKNDEFVDLRFEGGLPDLSVRVCNTGANRVVMFVWRERRDEPWTLGLAGRGIFDELTISSQVTGRKTKEAAELRAVSHEQDSFSETQRQTIVDFLLWKIDNWGVPTTNPKAPSLKPLFLNDHQKT